MPPLDTARPSWVVAHPDREVVTELVRRHGLTEVAAVLLANRGHVPGEDTKRFLHPELTKLHDPGLLPGMAAATDRLRHAVEHGETILVHGDYDVDGVTGTALLMRLFQHLGAKVEWHVPNRFTDGYAFGEHSLRKAREVGAGVVLSVDNGTSSVETIGALKEAGVDTVVTDHHEPPTGALPDATAIVNPKLDGHDYPFRELCGGAVAFKLAWGLCQAITGEARVRSDLRDFLLDAMGLVAIATVCDVVPLLDENRILARYGLKSLAATRFPGVRALLDAAGIGGRPLTAEDVGFQIGPRINASGRMGSAETAVATLMSRDPGEAAGLASQLDSLNHERRRLERELTGRALEEAERFADPERYPVLVVGGQGWHQGVIGIVAARLVDRFARPALVIGLDGESGKGSGRAPKGASILRHMHAGADLMARYGGHDQAAGCEVRAADLEALREAICDSARQAQVDDPPRGAELAIDAEVMLNQVSPELMRELERLEPCGARNEKPILVSRDCRLAEPPRVVGADKTHLILQLRRGERVLKGLAFGMAKRRDELAMGVPLDVVHTPRWNHFRGERNLELLLHDFEVSTPRA